MNDNYTMILLFIGSGTTILTLILAACYKSKCKYIKCCGISVERDIVSEMRQDSNNNNRLSLSGIPGPIIPPLQHISPV